MSLILLVGWGTLLVGFLEAANMLRQDLDLYTRTIFYILIYYFPAGAILGSFSLGIGIIASRLIGWGRETAMKLASLAAGGILGWWFMLSSLGSHWWIRNSHGLSAKLFIAFAGLGTATAMLAAFGLARRFNIQKAYSHPIAIGAYLTAVLLTGTIQVELKDANGQVDNYNAKQADLHNYSSQLISFTANSQAPKPNIIFILVDALRADYPGVDFSKLNTPNLKSFAKDGIVFSQSLSSCSWTRPSVASIFTGLNVEGHKVKTSAEALSEEALTLAEALKSSGYWNAALITNVNIRKYLGFSQGFDDYLFLNPDYYPLSDPFFTSLRLYHTMHKMAVFGWHSPDAKEYYQPAEMVTSQAIEYLQSKPPEPFFLYIHYLDPHSPYFVGGCTGVNFVNAQFDKIGKEALRNAYIREIEYFDKHLGTLLGYLKSSGLYNGSMIIFTSDHGEEFQDHGGWEHGDNLCDELTHVPLVIKRPCEATAGAISNQIVRSVDLYPTILAFAGQQPPKGLPGVNLFKNIEYPAFAISQYRSRPDGLTSIRTEKYRYINAVSTTRGWPKEMLFDIEKDPLELHNIAGDNEVEGLKKMLAEQLNRELEKSAALKINSNMAVSDNPNTILQLKALGYIRP